MIVGVGYAPRGPRGEGVTAALTRATRQARRTKARSADRLAAPSMCSNAPTLPRLTRKQRRQKYRQVKRSARTKCRTMASGSNSSRSSGLWWASRWHMSMSSWSSESNPRIFDQGLAPDRHIGSDQMGKGTESLRQAAIGAPEHPVELEGEPARAPSRRPGAVPRQPRRPCRRRRRATGSRASRRQRRLVIEKHEISPSGGLGGRVTRRSQMAVVLVGHDGDGKLRVIVVLGPEFGFIRKNSASL